MGSLSPAETEVKTLGTELEETLEEVLEETLGVIEELAFADEEKGVQILHEESTRGQSPSRLEIRTFAFFMALD